MHDELARSALSPFWELQQAALLDPASPLHREMEYARKAAESYQARFVLPEMTETARLAAEFSAGQCSEMAKYAEGALASVKAAMGNMSTPWADAQASLRSVASFAEIQGIGQALRTVPAFDEALSAALRTSLGDWRDPITWRPEIFTNLDARSDFYAGLGFNTGLTDFPPAAFAQSLDIAGLSWAIAPAADGRPAPVSRGEGDPEEQGLKRTNAAHNCLLRMERHLRSFIDNQMKQACGPNWPKHRLPNGMYEKWQEKKRKAEQEGAEARPLIDYIDFTEYEHVICRSDNWRSVFAPFFGRQESVRESFQRLHSVRLDTMHARLITQEDELLLSVEVRRLMRLIVNRRS
jgi:hypothetical protein